MVQKISMEIVTKGKEKKNSEQKDKFCLLCEESKLDIRKVNAFNWINQKDNVPICF